MSAIKADKDLHKNTLVVNFYAGPGAWKTTAALELTAALKKVGYDVEYVSEYAKELVREGKLDVLNDQKAVIEEQYKRLHNMAISGVEIIVTDSPLLLGQVYGQGKIDEAYHKKIREYYDSFDNFNLRVVRAEDATYQQEGRVENESQAKDLDERIRTMLIENKVFYGNYQRDEIEKTVERINQTYNRLYGEHKEKIENKDEKEQTFDRAEHIDAAVAGYMLDNTNKSLRESMYDVVQMSDKDVEYYANIYRKEKIGESKPTPKEMEYARAGYSLEKPNLSYRYLVDDVDEMSNEIVKEYATKYLEHLYASVERERREEQIQKEVQKEREEQIAREDFPRDFEDAFTRTLLDSIEEEQNNKRNKEPIMVPSQLVGWSDWSTDKIKNEAAREAAEWLINNNLTEEQSVKRAFYQRQTSDMSDDPRAEENDEEGIISVANEYKRKMGILDKEPQQSSKPQNQSEVGQAISNKENLLSPKEYYAQKNARRLESLEANVPAEMKQMKNWCAFKTYYDGATGKKKKIILSPETGAWARCNEPATWSTYEKAMQFAKERNCEGLSFALDTQNRIACVDLDHCIGDKGMRSDLCWDILNAERNTYAEKSVSGKGVHVFFKGDNVTLGCNVKDDVKGIECYDKNKFISMTGNIISKTNNLVDKPKKLIDCVRTALGPRKEVSNNQTSSYLNLIDIFMSDDEVIESIKKSKVGGTFERLYSGEDICGDKSRSDAKLMSMLAFFTNGDAVQMKSIFGKSGLYRENKGEKYIERTIDFAVKSLKIHPLYLGKKKVKQQTKSSDSQKQK